MRIISEEEILSEEVRKKIINDISGKENMARKEEAFKRYEIFKDGTAKYVRTSLLNMFSENTVKEMTPCISNISIAKKIISKLAQVYSAGVKREVEKNPTMTTTLSELCKLLALDSEMKRANQFLKLHRNGALYIRPIKQPDEKWYLKTDFLCPHLYDVVEHEFDRTKPLVYILTQFDSKNGNKTDELIADTPNDPDVAADARKFIWWSDSYHFTTDAAGKIISETQENLIGRLPFVNFAIDQDGEFWAVGGNDLIDGSILINAMLTNILYVGTIQGYGLLYVSGKNVPRSFDLSPTKGLMLSYEEGEPKPEVGFASAQPSLDSLRSLLETYVALLLTTNNLSTSGVSTQLNGSMSTPSGIALVIDKSESIEDINAQKQLFLDKEPEVFKIVAAWQDVLQMNESFAALKLPIDVIVKTTFNEVQTIQSESEKLGNLKLRKELGINTMIDLIMKDDPSLSLEQAELKLKTILEENATAMMQAISGAKEPLKEDVDSEDNQQQDE